MLTKREQCEEVNINAAKVANVKCQCTGRQQERHNNKIISVGLWRAGLLPLCRDKPPKSMRSHFASRLFRKSIEQFEWRRVTSASNSKREQGHHFPKQDNGTFST
jgi:hypothetical protein